MPEPSIPVSTLTQIIGAFSCIVAGIVAIAALYQRQYVRISIGELELRIIKRIGRLERHIGCSDEDEDE